MEGVLLIPIYNLHFLSSVPVFQAEIMYEKYPCIRLVKTGSMCMRVFFLHEHMSDYRPSAFLKLLLWKKSYDVVKNMFSSMSKCAFIQPPSHRSLIKQCSFYALIHHSHVLTVSHLYS